MPFRPALFLALAFFFLLPAAAQQTPPASPPQAATLLRQALAALNSGAPLTDVTLTGSARRIASDDESGTATFKALAGAGSRLDLSFSSGTRSEIRNVSAGNPTGSWSGPDGVAHPIAFHNLLTDTGLLPTLTLAAFASSSNAVITYVGAETRNGQAVQHLSLSQPPPFPDPPGGVSFAHLSQVDIFLDATTLLPAAVAFNIHPDDNALLDIPIEIRFSDYRSVSSQANVAAGSSLPSSSSAMVPFHIQKFLNNGLILDLQFQSATLNSGLPASDFAVPAGLSSIAFHVAAGFSQPAAGAPSAGAAQ